MHRVLLPFEFLEPTTVEDVVELADGQKARVLAGGVNLVLRMRLRKLVPEKVISIRKVPDLDYVEGSRLGLRFGALATLRQVERSAVVKEGWPLLAQAIGSIVSVQTKAMGTVVGNLCVGTPASDVASALYAMGAGVKIRGVDGEREIPIEEFFVNVNRTCLGSHEVVMEISVPKLRPGSGSAFLKLSKTADDIAKVNVAVSVTIAGGECTDAKIALGSVARTPLRATRAEESLRGKELTQKVIAEAAASAAEDACPRTSCRSTAEYRREMVRVLVKDALETAAGRAVA